MGDSDESSADGHQPREAPRLADHAGTCFITKLHSVGAADALTRPHSFVSFSTLVASHL